MAKTRWTKRRDNRKVGEEDDVNRKRDVEKAEEEGGEEETETVEEKGEEEQDEEETDTDEEKGEEERGGEEEEEEEEEEENDERSGEEEEGDGGEEEEEEGEVGGEDATAGIGEEEGEDEERRGVPDGMWFSVELPDGMWFNPSEYTKKMKISTRCYIRQTLDFFDSLRHPLTPSESRWFHNHPQWKHIFHMPMGRTHMSMGMWMLLLRTARTETRKEVWFIVNGIPIRYSLREHALISGLNCKYYDNPDYETSAGSDRFWKQNFKGLKVIRLKDVKTALEKMVPDRTTARLKMLTLYFICSVLDAPTKTGKDATPVKLFLLRAVDDLTFCYKFPWGRWTFEHMLGEIKHTLEHFERKGGVIGDGWSIPGFVIPMELLAFEAISQLSSNCREEHLPAKSDCPRMCKTRFKKIGTSGFSFPQINSFLGRTMDIDSILPICSDEEEEMLATITEEEYGFRNDRVVDNWMSIYGLGKTIVLKKWFEEDTQARGIGDASIPDATHGDASIPQPTQNRPENPSYEELVDLVMSMREEIDVLKARVASLEEV